MRSEGSGLFDVRAISASYGRSMIWLNELADADSRNVPPSAAPIVGKSTAPGAMAWPAAVVMTTSPLSRLFESSMYTPNQPAADVGGGGTLPWEEEATRGGEEAVLQARSRDRSGDGHPPNLAQRTAMSRTLTCASLA